MNRTNIAGSALFVCQAILDDVARVREVPTGDQKTVALQKAFRPGGNSFVAAMTCAKLGFKPDVISGVGNDLAGQLIEQKVRDAGFYWHPRAMKETPASIIMPNDGGRAIISAPDELAYEQDFPRLNIEGCRVIHFDGRHLDAAMHYMDEAQRFDVPTSIDVGRVRPGIEELLHRTTFPAVSKRFCGLMGESVDGMLSSLRKHAKAAAVTLGADGLRYFIDDGPLKDMPALDVPAEQVVDENGSGDIFNGARIYSYLTWPDRGWEWHFRFATAAVAHKIQRFGNEPPTLGEVHHTLRHYGIRDIRAA